LAVAATNASKGPSIQVTGVACVGVPVADQDRALGFYVGTLGFEKQLDVPMPGGGRWITVAPANGKGTALALVVAHEGVPAGVETGVRLTTPDAQAAYEALRAARVEVGELLRWPGMPAMFTLRDIDGNGLELIETDITASADT
jgi:catechol 2,3-dioxygenase-like lactoylglutathione lyase family enzyme